MTRLTRRIVTELGKGGPLSRIWIAHVSLGAMIFGLLSLPSRGPAKVLIPLFATAGVLAAAGCQRRSRRFVCAGIGVMIVAAWTRAVALWGVDQRGAGGGFIAAFAWIWIAGALILLLIAVWQRGIG